MIDFSCTLVGHGWLEATLTTETSEIKLTPSYLSDAPYNLINSLAALFDGQSETMCKWQDEPGEYRWMFQKEGDLLLLEILYFKDTFSRRTIKDAELILSGEENLTKFVHRVLRVFNKIKITHGDSGYKALWGYDFPIKAIDRLRVIMKHNQSI